MSSTGTRGVLLGVGEVARRLDVSKATVYRLVASGELPAIRLGGIGASVRLDEATLERWIRDHQTTAKENQHG
jgi:excisionase family DNA binding protein